MDNKAYDYPVEVVVIHGHGHPSFPLAIQPRSPQINILLFYKGLGIDPKRSIFFRRCFHDIFRNRPEIYASSAMVLSARNNLPNWHMIWSLSPHF
jgi:hypothetical protein